MHEPRSCLPVLRLRRLQNQPRGAGWKEGAEIRGAAVNEHVEVGSRVDTDEHEGYRTLGSDCHHGGVNHSAGQGVHHFKDGKMIAANTAGSSFSSHSIEVGLAPPSRIVLVNGCRPLEKPRARMDGRAPAAVAAGQIFPKSG